MRNINDNAVAGARLRSQGGVGERPGQSRAIVGDVRVNIVAAGQDHSARSQVDRGHGGDRAIDVAAGGVAAFAGVVEEVELDGGRCWGIRA